MHRSAPVRRLGRALGRGDNRVTIYTTLFMPWFQIRTKGTLQFYRALKVVQQYECCTVYCLYCCTRNCTAQCLSVASRESPASGRGKTAKAIYNNSSINNFHGLSLLCFCMFEVFGTLSEGKYTNNNVNNELQFYKVLSVHLTGSRIPRYDPRPASATSQVTSLRATSRIVDSVSARLCPWPCCAPRICFHARVQRATDSAVVSSLCCGDTDRRVCVFAPLPRALVL